MGISTKAPAPVSTSPLSQSSSASPSASSACGPEKEVRVKDDVGLAPVKDSFVQHNYCVLPDDVLAKVAQDKTFAKVFGVESRANTKEGTNPPSGWTNVILPLKDNYVELFPDSLGGPFEGQLGAGIGVQSQASVDNAKTNLDKLFDGYSTADVLLDVKDNSQPGDVTNKVKATTREIPQWQVATDKETNQPVFAGNWLGAWGTTETNPKTKQIESAQQTLKPYYDPHRLAERIVGQDGAAGAQDLANYAKFLAAHGFKLEVKGAAAGTEAPELSKLAAYFAAQEKAGAELTLVAHGGDKDGMVVRMKLTEDPAVQGFSDNKIKLREPAREAIHEVVVGKDGTKLAIEARKGSETATLSIVRPVVAGK